MINHEEEVEIFEESETILLTGDDGKDYAYSLVACVEYDGDFYALLQPEDDDDEYAEICVFEIANYESVDEDWNLEFVNDEKLADAVFVKCIEVYSAQCGGECSQCGGNCGK